MTELQQPSLFGDSAIGSIATSPSENDSTEKRSREEIFNDYEGFTDKFKPKLTTDDCYTPEPVYEAIRQWVNDNLLSLEGVEIIRPFWPGGDYQACEYPQGCLVLDNPPFSCLAEIRRWYNSCGIRYVLFAPTLTCNSASAETDTIILCNENITYHNGAVVNTALVTNVDCGGLGVWVSGSLTEAIRQANEELAAAKPKLPKYKYPANVTSTALLHTLARPGVELKIARESMHRISRMDNAPKGKAIYGYGWLLSEEARRQAEEARTETFALSERERAIIASLL